MLHKEKIKSIPGPFGLEWSLTNIYKENWEFRRRTSKFIFSVISQIYFQSKLLVK